MMNFRCCILIVSFIFVFWGCTSPEDSDDFSTIEELLYAVGVEPCSIRDFGNGYDNLNKNAQADWLVKDVQITRDGELRLNIELHYRSSTPDELTFVGSAVFLELIGAYVSEGRFTHGEVTSISLLFAPIAFRPTESRQAKATYKGNFELPAEKLIREIASLRWLKLAFAWVRVYQNTQGEYFYEWVSSSDSYYSPENLKMTVGKKYQEISGSLGLIYHPLPESKASGISIEWHARDSIYIRSVDYFDYVEWLKANAL